MVFVDAAPLSLLYMLYRIGERARQADRVATFRLSAESVQRGFSLGDDADEIVDALEQGIIDVVATDHAPHAAIDKEVPFEAAPNGVLGLEWAASVVTTCTSLDQVAFFNRMAVEPARIVGLNGHGRPVGPDTPANLVVFDPSASWVPTTTRSKSRNAPYFGRTLTGKVLATVYEGRVTHRETE
jgi:dihydroorotase